MLVLICALLCRRDLLTLDLTVCRQCPVEDTQPRPLFWSHMRPGTITDKTYRCGLRIWKWASPTSPQGWCRMMLGDLWSQSFILALYEVPLWLQKYCLEGISFGNLIHFRCCCVIFNLHLDLQWVHLRSCLRKFLFKLPTVFWQTSMQIFALNNLCKWYMCY